jgi:hypothetical protein
MTRLRPIILCAALAASAACGDTGSSATTPLNLDRPVDVAFFCHGGLRIIGDTPRPGEVADPLTVTSQPLESCRIQSMWAPEGERPTPPVGQEQLPNPDNPNTTLGPSLVEYFTFILESGPGTVAIARFDTAHPSTFSGIEVNLFDADELTPGYNSITVGSLPVAIGSDRAGCHAFTANAGSCDLSLIGVNSFVDEDPTTKPEITRVTVVNSLGEPVLARPAAMIAEPPEPGQPIGVECPAEPEGLAYIAYPDCHLVAAVRVATGTIERAIRFNPDGTTEIVPDGNVSCPAQCGGGGTFVAGERPVALDIAYDGRVDTRRLVIGAEDSAQVTVVELDADYLPLSFTRVALEGDIGVIDVAMSPQIGMGGSSGLIDDGGAAGGQHQFDYAVATDATVRVADVFGTSVECDTQVDPRYLRGVADIGRLACLPVGDLATPPRRAGARGPGIELSNDGIPRAIAIAPVQQFDGEQGVVVPPTEPAPTALVGYFGFVTSSTGETFVINIDDDGYVDFWDPTNPLGTMIAHVMPHQVRDRTGLRNDSAFNDFTTPIWDCSDEGSTGGGGPHLIGDEDGDGSLQLQDFDEVTSVKSYVMPGVRNVFCEDDEDALEEGAGSRNTPEDVAELAFAAEVDPRDLAFPDLRANRSDETWTFTWEGPLSRDDADQAIDGPSVRLGIVERDGNLLQITDATRPFCSIGVERFDIAVLTGCDPELGDAQCGVGQTCYTHPDSTVATGACLRADEADILAATCRDYLVSLRRYSVSSTKAGEIRIMPRRRILRTTPIEGCTSDTQCADLAVEQARLASPDHPVDWLPDPDNPIRTFSCGLDPTRGGPDRCMMTCEDDTGCDDGTRCSNGWCVEGVIPPEECLPGVQRFQLRGSDALIVVGGLTGHLHSIIEDPTTGECVPDPAAHPLMIGRIPLDPPPCLGDDDYTQLSPNPCSVTVEHVGMEPEFTFNEDTQTCTGGDPTEPEDNPLVFVTRDAPAIRFKNPALTFHLVDPWYPGDLNCRGDRLGGMMLPVVRSGFQLQLRIVAGFASQQITAPSVFPINVVRGPEDSIWVIDEGDNVPDILDSSSTRGQVFRIDPQKLGAVNVVQ